MAKLTMAQALNQALAQALEGDERVLILGEDVGRDGGVFRITDGLIDRFGPERVVDTPLAESGIVGTSVGLAMGGMRPIAEIQFFGFIYETMDQIASQAARVRFRSMGRFSAPLVIRTPYGGGVKAPEIHSDSLEALFVHTPGIKVVTPSNPYDAKGLLLAAVDDPDPVLFLEPMRLYRAFRDEVPEEPYRVPLGVANVVREGRDVTLIGWGASMPVVLQAADELIARHDVMPEVIDLRTLSPLDEATIVQSVQHTQRAVVVHEAVRTGGLGAEVAALVQERAFLYLEAPVGRVSGYDTPYPMTMFEDLWLPDATQVVSAALAAVRY
ncbi:Transketolase central region [Acidimicrobium ferrooxidans DSM 10331]|uniref:Transketolase central region n=1 Tax=Acidimicrobium ferrooxidans (strain DSM 10331 / JCM 15462 / NBRC 103882 / ICP) TaxID=525909 RepID=C7LYG2_ACIFD|nr:alpha-ketoacid dehydrogenase subunit beta [Acidimicrobium ferrooxidans]ACU53770.1 Transketolase central region [Acidimicrobium ferrooxidans DSM 10331]